MTMSITEMQEGTGLYSRFWRVEVDGLKADLLLSCVIGGMLHISFRDHFGKAEYNYCEEGDFGYPLPADFKPGRWYAKPEHFTNGEQDLYDYVRMWHPRREMQLKRHQEIGKGVRSPEIRDTRENHYGYLTVGDLDGLPNIGIAPYHIRTLTPVCARFPESWIGSIDGDESYFDPFLEEWMALARYARTSPYLHKWLWQLPEDVYETYRQLVAAVRKPTVIEKGI